MNVQFLQECNTLVEANAFLTHYFQGENFLDIKERFKKQSGYNARSDEVLSIMQKVYDELLSQVKIPADLAIYYDYFDETTRVENLAICILQSGICMPQVKQSNITQAMKDYFHANPNSFLSTVLGSEELLSIKEEDALKAIEEMQTSDNIKWNIWRVYKNYDQHLDKLMDTILSLIPIIKKITANYLPKFDSFYAYWSNACEDGTFYKKLKKASKIDIQETTNVIVHPGWLCCNAMSLWSLPQDPSTVYLYLGLLFQDKEFVKDTNLTNEELCQRLKLLSDTSKYEILRLIKKESLYGSQLADKLSLTTATISHHMSALSNAGLINITKDSNRLYYQLNKTQIIYLLDQVKNDLYED